MGDLTKQSDAGLATLIASMPPSVRRRLEELTQESPPSGVESRRATEGSQRDEVKGVASTVGLEAVGAESERGDEVALALRRGDGVCVLSGWLPKEKLLPAYMQAVSALEDQGREARMGGIAESPSASKWEDVKVRGDRIMWLSAKEDVADSVSSAISLTGPLTRVIDALKALRTRLLASGLNVGGRVSCQLAGYPGQGSRYVRHSDQSDSAPLRRVTAIVYLNPEWDTQVDGGQLVIYRGTAEQSNDAEDAKVVPPCGGRLVVFDSRLPHEVLPTFAARYAVTAWFSCDPNHSSHGLFLPEMASTQALGNEAVAGRETADSAVGDAGQNYLTCSGACLCPPPPIQPSPTLSSADDTPPEPSSELNGAIFVSIVSFCDPETAFTVLSLFEGARLPERIRVGIVWQASSGDITRHMHPLDGSPWRQFVREIRLDWREASGPCRARHLAASLWAGEPFVLQIDSHMRFARDWDADLLTDLRCAEAAEGHQRVVLSTYPPGYEGYGRDAHVPTDSRPTLLCASHFASTDGMLRIRARRLAKLSEDGPLPSLFWAAGFSFSRCQLLKEVPYDPHLPLLFFGEELLQLARMWTRGWVPYAPSRSVVFHLWCRDGRETFSTKVYQDPGTKRASQQQVKELLTGTAPPQSATAYGLGSVNGWAEFSRHCGVDFARGEIESWALVGGKGRSEEDFAG